MLIACKYELLKLIRSQGFVLLIFICLIFDVVSFCGNCMESERIINENTDIYESISDIAITNIKNNSDVGLMTEIYYEYSVRKPEEAYMSSEERFAGWKLSGLLLMLISIITAAILSESETKTKMDMVVYTIDKSVKKVYWPKLTAIFIITFVFSWVMLFLEIIILIIVGNGNPGLTLYTIPSYSLCWFGASIWSFRACKFMGFFVASLILALVSFLVAEISKKGSAGIVSAVAIWLITYGVGAALPDKLKQFSFLEAGYGDYIYEKFPVLFISENEYVHSFTITWGISFVILLLMMVVGSIYINRRNR